MAAEIVCQKHRPGVVRQRLHIDELPRHPVRVEVAADGKHRVGGKLNAPVAARAVVELAIPPARRNHQPTLHGPRR